MSGIVGSKFNHRGSGLVGSLGTDGQHMLSSGAGKKHVFETVAADTYDDEPIKADLTALAIREATNESSAAFNLPGSFIETFSDDTKLATQTDVDRTSGYISTVYNAYGTAVIFPWATIDVNVTSTGFSGAVSDVVVSAANNADDWFDTDGQNRDSMNTTTPNTATVVYDFNATYRFSGLLLGKRHQHGAFKAGVIQQSTNGSDWTAVDFTGWSGAATGDSTANIIGAGTYYHSGSAPSGTGLVQAMGSDGSFNWYQMGVQNGYEGSVKQKITGFTAFDTRYLKLSLNSQHSALNTNASLASFAPFYQPLTAANEATGTLIQAANAVTGTRTSVGGTMLYSDEDGTATIGTDLKIYFTANGGSGWTEAASYTAITPVYASGIKQVRLGKTTVTGGTDVRYKAVWANQSNGSKVTRLHAIGINY